MQTELQRQHERHKAFHAHIASLAASRVQAIVPPPAPKPIPVFRYVPQVAIVENSDEKAWALAICEPDGIAYRLIVPTIPSIQKAVCRHFKVTWFDLVGDCREGWVIRPRFVSMYLCRELARRSWSHIGKQHGGRDHSTAIHGHRTCIARMERDQSLAGDIDVISCQFKERI